MSEAFDFKFCAMVSGAVKVQTHFLKTASAGALLCAAIAGWSVSDPVQARPTTAPPPTTLPTSSQPPGMQSAFPRTAQQKPPIPQAKPPAPPAAAEPAPAPAPPSAPQRIETINYGSWTVTCRDTVDKASKKVCSGALQVVQDKTRQVLLAWIIGRDNQGTLRTVIQTPTGVQIPKGLELTLGKAATRTMPYTACEPQRCEASAAFDDGMIKDAIASAEAKAMITAIDGRAITFNLQIKGIDQVFAAIGK